jgi:hypothetical protein
VIRRRSLLNIGLATAATGFSFARAATPQAPRRDLLSVNLRSSEMRLLQVDQLSTFMVTLPFECDFNALRIGLANITPTPYHIAGVCCAQGFEWIPDAAPGWAYFNFSGSASASETPSAPAPMPAMVAGNTINQTGATNVPAITWSDWMAYRTQPSGYRPQMVFRFLIPPQTLPMGLPGGPGLLTQPQPNQPERLIAEAAAPGDFVSHPTAPVRQIQGTFFSPLYVIQYRPVTPGVQIVIGGDSQFAGWDTFARQVAMEISTPERPITVWDAAWSGQPSKTFWPVLDQAINLARPSISVIQGWSGNDGMTPERDQAQLPHVKESAQHTFATGGVPVIVKGLPRRLFGKPELASWQNINQKLDDLVANALVFDPKPFVEDPQRPGDWRPGLSVDGVHPNAAGNKALSLPFLRLIAPALAGG